MTSVVTPSVQASRPTDSTTTGTATGHRSNALAERLLQGAGALESLARTLTDDQWRTRVPRDGRTIGVVVHHVASIYPLEVELAQLLASGQAIANVTWDDVHALNARHAASNQAATRDETLELLRRNSALAADVIRALSDEELDRANAVSLNANAPLTCQFFLEDHAVRHSFHHLAAIRAMLASSAH